MIDPELDKAVTAFTAHVNKVFDAKPGHVPIRVYCTGKSDQWFHLHAQEFRTDYRNEHLPADWHTTYIYCFVARQDMTNRTMGAVFRGSIYKPASFAKPARHSRGSVFDDSTWGCAGRYGIASLR